LLRQSEILKLDGHWHCNTIPTRLKCPGCRLGTKRPAQTPVHKSVKSLSRHIGIEHKGEFWVDECRTILKNISLGLDSGVICHD